MAFGQMQWLEDIHIVTAAEAALADVARGWNWNTQRWESMNAGASMTRSRFTNYKIRNVNIRVQSSAGSDRRGVLVQYGIVGDPTATDRVMRLKGGDHLTTGHSGVNWQGDYPFCAGFYWRITEGGTVDGTLVIARIGYV